MNMVWFPLITLLRMKQKKIYSMLAILYLETHDYITIVQETF